MSATSGEMPSSSVARQRWRLLSRAVANYGQGKSVSLTELNSLTTVRQFCQFGLFNITEPTAGCSDDEFVEQIWQHVDHTNISLRLYLRQRVPVTACLNPLAAASSAADDGNNNSQDKSNTCTGNNTGNICVWPSEEVLAHYVIAQAHLGRLLPREFENDNNGIKVCELGGGLTCLAGLAAGAVLQPWLKHLLLTDGDKLACNNAARCLAANREMIIGEGVDARVAQLAWEDADFDHINNDRYHLVLCADCLFFRESHQSLLRVLDKLLMLPKSSSTVGGLALICAPSRGRSVEDFARLAEAAGFDVRVSDNYDARVSQTAVSESASFVPDLHLPLMLRLTRR